MVKVRIALKKKLTENNLEDVQEQTLMSRKVSDK